MKLKILIVLILGFLLSFLYFQQKDNRSQKPVLKIFTYSSFQSGPGDELVKKFEKTCDCRVNLIRVGSAGLILQRMRLEDSHVDVIVGLDNSSVLEAQKLFSWKKINVSKIKWDKNLGSRKENISFVPYNFSPMTFIYRKDQVLDLPKNFPDLFSPRFKKKISLQDPRQSTPGLEFLLWTVHLSKLSGSSNGLLYYKNIKKNIYRISPSWSSSYGLFVNKKARLAFSFVTSLVYHWKDRLDFNYQALSFEEGHPVKIEYMAIPDRCKRCDLAQKWVQFLLTPSSQALIRDKNFMFPAIEGLVKGTVFQKLPVLKINKIPNSIYKDKKKWIDKWKSEVVFK